MVLILSSQLIQAQWRQATGLRGTSVLGLYFHGDTIFAGANDGIYRSVNNGDVWQRIWNERNRGPLTLNGEVLLTQSSYEYKILRSDDQGETWRQR